MLVVLGLTKSFIVKGRPTTVFEGLSFQLAAGQCLALTGANGVGKTTLLRILAGVLLQDRGTAEFAGRPLHLPEVRRQVGYCTAPQVGFPERLSGLDNLRLAARLYGLSGADAEAKIQQLCQELDMGEFVTRAVRTYSTGQNAALRLAWALLHTPQLLLIDEFGDGLDPSRYELALALLKRRQESGCSTLVATHRLGELDGLSPSELALGGGCVQRVSPPTDG